MVIFFSLKDLCALYTFRCCTTRQVRSTYNFVVLKYIFSLFRWIYCFIFHFRSLCIIYLLVLHNCRVLSWSFISHMWIIIICLLFVIVVQERVLFCNYFWARCASYTFWCSITVGFFSFCIYGVYVILLNRILFLTVVHHTIIWEPNNCPVAFVV